MLCFSEVGQAGQLEGSGQAGRTPHRPLLHWHLDHGLTWKEGGSWSHMHTHGSTHIMCSETWNVHS